MMTSWLLLISVAVVAISGVPALLMHRRSMPGQRIAACVNVIGSALGAGALVSHILRPDLSREIALPWGLPLGGFVIELDDISLVFLVPVFLISALGSIYGLSYWSQRNHPGNGRQVRLCWGILTAAMALVVLARDGILFLVAWEVMALAAFFLVSTEDTKVEVREAAWVYLVAAHVGTLFLFGFFSLLRYATGSFALWPSGLKDLSPHAAGALFVLGAVGFGVKA